MKILAKLLTGFLVVALLCGIVGYVGIKQLGEMSRSLTKISTETIPSLEYLNIIAKEFLRVKVAVRNLANPLGASTPGFQDKQYASVDAARAAYKPAMASFEKLAMVPEEARLWGVVKDKLANAAAYNDRIMTESKKVPSIASPEELDAHYRSLFAFVFGDSELVLDDIIAALDAVIAFDQKHYGRELPEAAMKSAQAGVSIVLAVTVSSFLVALLLGAFLGISISRSLRKSVSILDKLAAGDISERMETRSRDEFRQIAASLNNVSANIEALIEEAGTLTKATVEGRLATRGDAAKFSGGYHQIVEGINNTLDVVITPINETIAVMKRMADGDLTVDMSGDYRGDFDILKTALNGSVGSINDILDQVNTAVEQVAAGSLQVSQASQALSQGATEQASSLEEITSSITEVSGQTKQNTENAIQVNGLARSAKESAERGNRQMQDLVAAMNDINVSAEEIRKIVKAIDDISFQINLLALNANVEAARAGKYGKGFAVVAEEVRNLAVRSADSVKETTRMVDEAIANIERGNGLVDVTAKQLAAIVDGAAKVADLAEEVSAASKEQTQGLEQITLGLNQIDQVTQANTASAEESAAAAEELSSQAQQLKGTVARFKLREREVRVSNSDILQLLRAELARQQGPQGHALKSLAALAARDSFPQPAGKPAQPRKAAAPRLNPADVISLDDDNFGKF